MYQSMAVMLYVSDVERSVNFYKDALGFGFKGYWDDVNHCVTFDFAAANNPSYCEMTFGEFKLGIHLDPEFQAGSPRFELQIGVDSVNDTFERFAAAGAKPSEPKDFPWGMRMFSLKDPDGHVWNFTQAI